MTTVLNQLFQGQQATNSTSGNTLAGTQQLTAIASEVAKKIADAMSTDLDNYQSRILESQTNMVELDKLIKELGNVEELDTTYFASIDNDTLESMLKSQQSKRSRCKSKQMTADNYTSMMTAAIAEAILRKVMNKEKGSFGRQTGAVAYDEERLQKLAEDQEALRKEIRNIQSKKSILKNKADFKGTEEDERWIALEVAEGQLKAVRVDGGSASKVEYVDEVRDAIKELLAEVDIDKIKLNDAKQLLSSIFNTVFSDTTEETTEGEGTAE